jgi:hypothetical protein
VEHRRNGRSFARSHPPHQKRKIKLTHYQDLIPSVQGIVETNGLIELLSGHYTDSGGLSGDDLYLFPDKTYIYMEWADILPRTIRDQGAWEYQDSFITLYSDAIDGEQSIILDSVHLAFTAIINTPFFTTDENNHVFLLGYNDLKYFLYKDDRIDVKDGDNESFFLLHACSKKTPITMNEMNEIKENLYARCSPSGLVNWHSKMHKFGMATFILAVLLLPMHIITRDYKGR